MIFPAATAAAAFPARPWGGKGCAGGWWAGLGVPQHPFCLLLCLLARGHEGAEGSSAVSCRDLKTCCSSKASFDFTVTSSSETHSYYTAE